MNYVSIKKIPRQKLKNKNNTTHYVPGTVVGAWDSLVSE